nr:MAG TPA: hypothetical protein [Caudoviricetes sp.]
MVMEANASELIVISAFDFTRNDYRNFFVAH